MEPWGDNGGLEGQVGGTNLWDQGGNGGSAGQGGAGGTEDQI